MAQLLDKAGADALVLFNRFLQPDIDAEELAVMSESPSPANWRGGSADVHRIAARQPAVAGMFKR